MLDGLKLPQNKIINFLLKIVIMIFIIITISFTIFSPNIPISIAWRIGQIAPETITASLDLQFESKEDKLKTELLKQKRASLVMPVYSIDETINKSVDVKIVSLFTYLKSIKRKPSLIYQSKWYKSKILSMTDLRVLLNEDLNALQYITLNLTNKLLFEGITEIDEDLVLKINQELLKNNLSTDVRNILQEIIYNSIKANLYFDPDKTNLEIDKELKSITPFKTIIKVGQPIIYKGEVVTAHHIEILKDLNMYDTKINLFKLSGVILLVTLLFFIIERTLYFTQPRIYKIQKYPILIYFTIFLVLLIARLLEFLPVIKNVGEFQFMIPILIVPLITTLLISESLSMFLGIITAVLIGVMYKGDFSLLAYLVLSLMITVFVTNKSYRRFDQIKAGYLIGVVNVFIIISLGLFKEINQPSWYVFNSILGFLNGVISSMILIAFIPYIESLFRITTSQTLLEQANLNHPLLKQLMLSAPGTYQHSLMVANLAEAAAESIGANNILARTGGYFHDIGKLKRPLFYIENQYGTDNPHKNLSPRLSKIIIQSHVPDGLNLANKFKLPQILKDFIQQHHGTSLVSFFYSKAMYNENLKVEDLIEEDFRYEGPKPQTKEIAIIMLADSIEAAMRTVEKPTPTKIENLVNKVINDKIADNQLDECPISLKEIELIEQTFLKVLKGVYHNRLNYEDELNKILDQK
ncbi:MAG: HDIG domain-containing metalloprotein [Candidatus Margulisiibacteriota bacterium]|jgi:hypothetical protein